MFRFFKRKSEEKDFATQLREIVEEKDFATQLREIVEEKKRQDALKEEPDNYWLKIKDELLKDLLGWAELGISKRMVYTTNSHKGTRIPRPPSKECLDRVIEELKAGGIKVTVEDIPTCESHYLFTVEW